METLSKQLLDKIQDEGIFKPEFLNRFDQVVAFRPLTAEELEKVTDLLISALNKRLSDRQITVSVTPGARKKLAKIGFDPVFGARALSRTITNLVENKVAEAILQNSLKNGNSFEVTEEMVQ